MRVEDFAGTSPPMALEDFFAGQSRAWGIFQDRFGRLRQQFAVNIDGEWDARSRTLTLTEDFTYHGGEQERRVWTIEKLDEHRYRGCADGIVGTAFGAAFGNALRLSYRMRVKIGGKDWTLDFDDWMFRQGRNVVINRATVRKWGLVLGTATIFFRKAAERHDDLGWMNPESQVAVAE